MFDFDTLQTRLQQLEQANASLRIDNVQIKTQVQQSESRYVRAQQRLRLQAGLAFGALVSVLLLSPANRAAIAQGYGVTLASLNTRLLAVEAKTQFQSANSTAKTTTFSGCNVFIQSGSGSTSDGTASPDGTPLNNGRTLTGLGNLTIGYNLSRVPFSGNDTRMGSHNLIMGDLNNYSSFGGVVVGVINTISGPSAFVSGGQGNTASGNFASVSGGVSNTASGQFASVSGGESNTASGASSSVSGGSSLTQNQFLGWSGGTYHSP